MNNKERQAKFRKERKAKGLVRKEIWIKPEWWEKLKELIASLDRNN